METACERTRGPDDPFDTIPMSGLSVASALILAGTQEVLATQGTICDLDAREVVEAILDEVDPLQPIDVAESLRQAQIRAARTTPDGDWWKFRVYPLDESSPATTAATQRSTCQSLTIRSVLLCFFVHSTGCTRTGEIRSDDDTGTGTTSAVEPATDETTATTGAPDDDGDPAPDDDDQDFSDEGNNCGGRYVVRTHDVGMGCSELVSIVDAVHPDAIQDWTPLEAIREGLCRLRLAESAGTDVVATLSAQADLSADCPVVFPLANEAESECGAAIGAATTLAQDLMGAPGPVDAPAFGGSMGILHVFDGAEFTCNNPADCNLAINEKSSFASSLHADTPSCPRQFSARGVDRRDGLAAPAANLSARRHFSGPAPEVGDQFCRPRGRSVLPTSRAISSADLKAISYPVPSHPRPISSHGTSPRGRRSSASIRSTTIPSPASAHR